MNIQKLIHLINQFVSLFSCIFCTTPTATSYSSSFLVALSVYSKHSSLVDVIFYFASQIDMFNHAARFEMHCINNPHVRIGQI